MYYILITLYQICLWFYFIIWLDKFIMYKHVLRYIYTSTYIQRHFLHFVGIHPFFIGHETPTANNQQRHWESKPLEKVASDITLYCYVRSFKGQISLGENARINMESEDQKKGGSIQFATKTEGKSQSRCHGDSPLMIREWCARIFNLN